METLGQIAYEAWLEAAMVRGYTGSGVVWELCGKGCKETWEEAAKAVAHSFVHMPYSEVMKVVKEVG